MENGAVKRRDMGYRWDSVTLAEDFDKVKGVCDVIG